MSWDELLAFLRPELIIIVVVLYCLGLFLKKSPLSDWLIPFILLGVSIIITPAYLLIMLGVTNLGEVIVSGWIQGIIAASIAVFGNQLIHQAINKSKEGE